MDKRIEELLPFYALDALTEEERVMVAAYLAAHPEAQAQISEMEEVVSALPYGVPPVEPTGRARQLLMERISADQGSPFSARSNPIQSWLIRLENILRSFPRLAYASLSLSALALVVAWVIILNRGVSRLQAEVSALRAELQAQAGSLEQAHISLEQLNTEIAQTTPTGLMIFALQGTEHQPQAHGQLIADQNSQSAVLVVAGLAPLRPDRVYQIWLIQGETPTSAGILEVDDRGQGVLILRAEEVINSFNALGISIEPQGGSLRPTGDIVILSNLT